METPVSIEKLVEAEDLLKKQIDMVNIAVEVMIADAQKMPEPVRTEMVVMFHELFMANRRLNNMLTRIQATLNQMQPENKKPA